jgi:hypothetical protein
MIDRPINWDFGTPLHSWWKEAPRDWRAIDINLSMYEADGYAKRVPLMGNAHPTVHANTIRLGCGAIKSAPSIRVIIHDDRHGWGRLELTEDKPVTTVVDFPSEKERIARHRSKSDRHLFPDGKTINIADNEMVRRRGIVAAVDDFIAAQKTVLPGLPGGPPLVPSPVIEFENGHLSAGRDVLERIIRNNKAELVTLQFGKSGPAFPSHIHLFELSANVCASINRDDRKQMIEDLHTAGLLRLPYNEIAVRFYVPDLLHASELKAHVTFAVSGNLSPYEKIKGLHGVASDKMFDQVAIEFLDGRPPQILKVSDLNGTDDGWDLLQIRTELVATCLDALTTLVLALATRNVVKRTATNNRLGTGQRTKARFQGPQGAIYLSSTVVEAPEIADMEADPDHPAREGTSPRPHMRRGHLHTVLHGVGRRERRVHWFPAVFVNADPTFVAGARKYVVMP